MSKLTIMIMKTHLNDCKDCFQSTTVITRWTSASIDTTQHSKRTPKRTSQIRLYSP